MDERAFYTETIASKPASLNCPHCRISNEYELRWIVRRKKERLPGAADERDRARFAKAQSYMVLADDKATCANRQCRKTFDISGIKSMAFLSPDQEAALTPRPQPQQNRAAGPPRRGPQQQRPKFKTKGNVKGGPPQHQKAGQQQKQKQKKKPKVYFPSDYIYYRP